MDEVKTIVIFRLCTSFEANLYRMCLDSSSIIRQPTSMPDVLLDLVLVLVASHLSSLFVPAKLVQAK